MTLLVRALFIDSRPNLRWVHSLFSSGARPHRRGTQSPAGPQPTPAPPEDSARAPGEREAAGGPEPDVANR